MVECNLVEKLIVFFRWNDREMAETSKRTTNNSTSKSRKSKNDIIRSTLGTYLKQKNYSVSWWTIVLMHISKFIHVQFMFGCAPNLNHPIRFTANVWMRKFTSNFGLLYFIDEWKISEIRLSSNANNGSIWCHDDVRRRCG